MAEAKKIQVIYGSRVCSFTGPAEAKRGRVTIWQDLIPELHEFVYPEDVECRIFGPLEILERIRRIFELSYDRALDLNSAGKCLFYHGDTAELVPLLESKIPDLEFLNSDDDEVFARELR